MSLLFFFSLLKLFCLWIALFIFMRNLHINQSTVDCIIGSLCVCLQECKLLSLYQLFITELTRQKPDFDIREDWFVWFCLSLYLSHVVITLCSMFHTYAGSFRSGASVDWSLCSVKEVFFFRKKTYKHSLAGYNFGQTFNGRFCVKFMKKVRKFEKCGKQYLCSFVWCF